jgi:hypothetical protein
MARLASGEGAALVERFRRYLRDHHQPVTQQRDHVAEIVLTSDDHLSVEQIRRRLASWSAAASSAVMISARGSAASSRCPPSPPMST